MVLNTKINTIIKAVDICFKVFHIFNVEYSLESYNFWLFIQKYYFKIKNKI